MEHKNTQMQTDLFFNLNYLSTYQRGGFRKVDHFSFFSDSRLCGYKTGGFTVDFPFMLWTLWLYAKSVRKSWGRNFWI